MTLCVVFAAVAWYSLMIYMIISGEVKHYPNLYNKGNPLYYLFAPCSYLYIRFSLSKKIEFKKTDWLHFIPALLALIDIVPYMLKTIEEKQYIVDLVAKDVHWNMHYKYAFITQADHYVIRGVQMIIYLFFQWKVFLKYKKNIANHFQKRWFYTYQMMVTINVCIVTIVLTEALFKSATALREGPFPILISVGIVLFCLSLFLRPEQLYGLNFNTGSVTHTEDKTLEPNLKKQNEESKQEVKEFSLTAEQVESYIKKLNRKLLLNECYKEKGLTVNKLAGKIDISPRNLSWLLSNHYNIRFTDFINGYRIDYVKKRLLEENWRNLTLEALASEAGFSSRSTFYSAFKKSTGLSPAEYILQISSEESSLV